MSPRRRGKLRPDSRRQPPGNGALKAYRGLVPEPAPTKAGDEARVGQQGTPTRVWAKKGSRPRAPRDRRYDWAYIFGAACPRRGTSAALVLPYVNAEGFNLHLREIAKAVALGAHGVVIIDGAGYHGAGDVEVPGNLTLITLPPPDQAGGRLYSPELNAAENIWEYLRKNKLASTVWNTYADIVEACCTAWRFFADDPAIVTSITSREWAKVIV